MGTYWEIALDILLPRACAHCREDLRRAPGPLCRECAAGLPPPPEPACVRCAGSRGGPAPSARTARPALLLPPDQGTRTAGRRLLVHAFKFR